METYVNITFPSNLEKKYSAFILIKGQKWGTKYRDDLTADFITLDNYISLALPMPTGGLSDSTTHNWEGTQGALLNISKGNITKMIMKGALDKLKATFTKSVTALEFKSGRTINDYAALTYGGHGFREFEFEFELIPNNVADADKILEIIKALKFGSLPKNTGATIQYPFFWNVKAINPSGVEYFNMKKCVITNLSINKFQGDTSTIHMDGHPIQTNITIGFTELYKEWQNNI